MSVHCTERAQPGFFFVTGTTDPQPAQIVATYARASGHFYSLPVYQVTGLPSRRSVDLLSRFISD